MSLLSTDITKVKKLSLREVIKPSSEEDREDSFLFVAFDTWINKHPKGGLFNYKGRAFKVSPKET